MEERQLLAILIRAALFPVIQRNHFLIRFLRASLRSTLPIYDPQVDSSNFEVSSAC